MADKTMNTRRKRLQAELKAKGAWFCPHCKRYLGNKKSHIRLEHLMSIEEFEDYMRGLDKLNIT